jgi:uncharacterized membrane protein HdeD (DUF308 family)
MARGIFAIALGTIMLVHPLKTPAMLLNFMGMYWLASGIVSLRWGIVDFRNRRMALAAGTIAILTGIAVLVRRIALNVVQEAVFLVLLGMIILMTGFLHLFGGFRTRQEYAWQQRVPNLLLGIFEVILGVLLIVSPLDRGPIVYISACSWALLGGVILLGDAWALRRARLKQGQIVH